MLKTNAPAAICEMWTKASDLEPDCFPAYNHTAFGHQVFDVGRAHCDAMVRPNSIYDDFASKLEAPQAQDAGWGFMTLK
jgi:hypothetical protein